MKPAVAKLLAAFLLCLLVAAPAGAAWTGPQRADFVTSFIADHIVPRHAVLASRAQEMQVSAGAFCTAPSQEGLAGLRRAFSNAYLAWMGVQHLRFGPALRDDAHYRLQFWPDKHGQGAKQIRRLMLADTPVPDAADLAKSSVAIQGFPALERVLFADDAALLAGDVQAKRRCALIGSISTNVVNVSLQLQEGWAAYRPDDTGNAMREIVRAYLEHLQAVSELKLKRPFGASLEAARPKRAEAWRSRLSFAAVDANLDALGAVFMGEGRWRGFKSHLPSDDETQSMASAIEEHFGYGRKVVAGQPSTLRETVQSEEGRRTLVALISTIEEIREFSFVVLPEALGVTLGFNSLDGD